MAQFVLIADDLFAITFAGQILRINDRATPIGDVPLRGLNVYREGTTQIMDVVVSDIAITTAGNRIGIGVRPASISSNETTNVHVFDVSTKSVVATGAPSFNTGGGITVRTCTGGIAMDRNGALYCSMPQTGLLYGGIQGDFRIDGHVLGAYKFISVLGMVDSR